MGDLGRQGVTAQPGPTGDQGASSSPLSAARADGGHVSRETVTARDRVECWCDVDEPPPKLRGLRDAIRGVTDGAIEEYRHVRRLLRTHPRGVARDEQVSNGVDEPPADAGTLTIHVGAEA